jgi:hypothetical protein
VYVEAREAGEDDIGRLLIKIGGAPLVLLVNTPKGETGERVRRGSRRAENAPLASSEAKP